MKKSDATHVVLLTGLFVITLNYSGPGFNLHWLSFAVGVLFVWLSYLLIDTDIPRLSLARGWLVLTILLYLAWLFVSPFFSTYHYASSTTATGLAVLPLTFVGWLLIPREGKVQLWESVWRILLLVSLVLAVWGMFDFLVRHVRAHAIFLDPNAYAALLNLFLLPVAHEYMNAPPDSESRVRHRALLLAVALLALGQFMSLSRGALIALGLTLPLLLWLNRRIPHFRSRTVMLLAIMATAYILVKAIPINQNNGIEDFLAAPKHYVERDAGIQERLLLWKSTWKMFLDANPLTGNGLGSFKIHYAAYRDEHETSLGNFAHNDYLQALHDGGIIQFSFFVILTLFAPLWILRKSHRSRRHHARSNSDSAPGLMLGLICISLHAFVNFIHFVGPMIFIGGLYLARSWTAIQPIRELRLPRSLTSHVQPGFLKGMVILLLAFPTAVLAIDGIIFKLFATDDAFHARLEPNPRFSLINLALSVRPANPMPRVLLVRAMLRAAEKTDLPEEREMLLAQAEHETRALSADAPALAIGQHFFMGKILALRGGPENLVLARASIEHAVKLVPPATGMRLELLKVYLRLGQEHDAYQTTLEAKKWIKLEVDLASLAAFAKEARLVALQHGDNGDANLWSWIYDRLAVLGYAG